MILTLLQRRFRRLAAIGSEAWQPYRPGSPERNLLESGRFKTVETNYDWTLNSQAKAAAAKRRS
jgi:hypothetical protein